MTSAGQGHNRTARARFAVGTKHAGTSVAEMGVSGNLDVATAPALSCVIEGHLMRGRRFLRIDVSQLRIGDAEGLAVLVDAHRRLLAARGTLILTGVPDIMRTVIESAGLADELFLIAPTAEEIRTRRPVSTYA